MMKLSLRKIAGLKTADIELNGLTVIAGENDTGKSTVGKIIFAVIKAISKYEDDLIDGKYNAVYELVEDLYLNLRRESQMTYEMRKGFHPKNFMRQLKPYINSQNSKQLDLFGNEPQEENIRLLLKTKKNAIIDITSYDSTHRKLLLNNLNKIYQEIFEDKDEIATIRKALSRVFISEFYKQISPKHDPEAISEIKLTDGENKLLEINIAKNKVENLELHDDILPFEDVTFIETPILMQMYDVINQSETLFELNSKRPGRPKIAFHIKDLISKLRSAPYFTEEENSDVKEIIATINGAFEFNSEEKDFIFSKKTSSNETIRIKSTNTASGIKSFGMLQLLLESDILNKKSLLIIDEPETHLHPSWQVKYAEIIVKLVKKNIPVLVTSHSPYMIQALKYYSEKNEITNDLKFYLSNREGNWCNISDVTNDLNKIFTKLAKPLQQLVWE